MAKQTTVVDVRDLIINKMKDQGSSLTWLSTKTKIPYGTLHSCLKRKLFLLNDVNLAEINRVLGTNFKN